MKESVAESFTVDDSETELMAESVFRPKRKIILFPEMRVTRKIFTRTSANLFFFNQFKWIF